jgi:thiamine-phosphate pyrophosphorylase
VVDNFKLIVISHSCPLENEAKILTDLFSRGLELLHLRKPNTNINYLKQVLKQIPNEFHNRIVVHQHYTLSNYFDLKGIHIKSKNNNIAKTKLTKYQDKYNVISRSCHSISTLSKKINYEYVFLSPIFNSISKENYNSQFSLEELKQAQESGIIDNKVIALGGITPNNVSIIRELGFGGVAALGYI